jgi:hypothetical protein
MATMADTSVLTTGPAGPANVLVVANKTAATAQLVNAVRERADRGPARFHLLIPDPGLGGWRPSDIEHPDVSEGEQMLALALPLLQHATQSEVTGSVSVRHDPMDAIEEAIAAQRFDEIILSTLPHPVSIWLHVDLPRRVAGLGLPVTTVTAGDPPAAQ